MPGPYTCVYCDTMLESRSDRDKHLEQAHNITKPFYMCPYCNSFTSRRKEGVQAHVQHVHKRKIRCAEVPEAPKEQVKAVVLSKHSRTDDPKEQEKAVGKQVTPKQVKSIVVKASEMQQRAGSTTPTQDERDVDLTGTPDEKPKTPDMSRRATKPRPVFAGKSRAPETISKSPELAPAQQSEVAPVQQSKLAPAQQYDLAPVQQLPDRKKISEAAAKRPNSGSDSDSSSSSSSSDSEEPARKVVVLETTESGTMTDSVEQYDPQHPEMQVRNRGTQTDEVRQQVKDSDHTIKTIQYPDGRKEVTESWTYFRYL